MALPTSTNEVTVRKLSATIQALWTKIKNLVGGKADKVSDATSGNLAGLDANGNLMDSGKKPSDFATSEQGAAASTAVQSVKINGGSELKSGTSVNIPLASTSAAGAMSAADKTKLNGIATGAQVNVIEDVKVNGASQTVTNKSVDIAVPVATTTSPKMNGTASVGSENMWAKGDHVHPTDTSREAAANKETSLTTSSNTKFPTSKAVADFVNSSIATNTATFRGTLDVVDDLSLTTSATNSEIATALGSHSWGSGVTITNNDYCFVTVDDPSTTTPDVADEYRRFKYNGSAWEYEYTLNNSSFTAAQDAAINSGITSADKSSYDAHIANTNNPHGVTKSQVGLDKVGNFKAVSTEANQGLTSTEKSNARTNIGAGTYSKPSGGIPKTDLSSDVQASLDRADSAVQDISGKLDKNGDGKDVTVTFTAASSRTNISSTETLASLFGKIAKWFTALGSLAFKSQVSDSDVNGTISDSHIASADNWNSKASGSHTHSVKINGVTKTIAATGGTAVDLGSYLTTHQTVKQDGVTGATVNRFGTCSTAAGTAAKTAGITSGTFSLEAGAMVAVKFSATNTASNPTINIDGTGAKNVYVNGSQITTGANIGLLTGAVILIYDGTQYHLVGNYYDSNSTDFAPVDHSSTATTYGLGTTSKYGHMMLVTGDMNGKSNADGKVPSLNHTHSQYQTTLTEMTDQEVEDLIAALT